MSASGRPRFAACWICRHEDKDFRQFPVEELHPYGNVYLCDKHYSREAGLLK